MDDKTTFIWLIIVLLVLTLLNLESVAASGRRKLAAKEGFISIDCGIAEGSHYTDDETQISYRSDAGFIDTGVNYNVSKEFINQDMDKQFMNVRSFPEGNKNCYTLWPKQGKDNKYLIRARFMYGNYDSQNQLPVFKLYLGVDEWETVNVENASAHIRREIIHVPKTDSIDVCLVNNGSGTPFISALELRHIDNSIYAPTEPGSLLKFGRWDFGPQEDGVLFRDKDDPFDRIWTSWASPEWSSTKAQYESSSFAESEYKLPRSIMMDAATPANVSLPLTFSLDLSDDPSQNLYIYMHFAEVQIPKQGNFREFTVSVNDDESWGGEPQNPKYMVSNTLNGTRSVSGSTTNLLSFTLKRTNKSTLPPIINAIEVYKIKEFPQSSTLQDDVNAIQNIKSRYKVSKLWQGDPCLPRGYSWDGVQCSDTDSPAIISLNLSSSNLTGNILDLFGDLTSLQNLDLSYNNLTGPVPGFFAELSSLTVLNLTGNQLRGSVPQAVLDKFKDGTLSLGENPNLCLSVSCQGKKKNKFSVPVLASILCVVSLMLIVTPAIIWKFRRRGTKGTGIEMVTKSAKEESLMSGNSEFTFPDVQRITNDFSKIIGGGGFGKVYLGTLIDGTQVAVKVRSHTSIQGPKELRAEAKLLMRVHHKNLVRIIGYCNDGTNMALIYEHMSNGSLRQKLIENKAEILNWKERLQIAVDAAQGLDYLHNGCKPPIVHRDMKSSNILLDKKLRAKIADFGTSRDLPAESGTFITTAPAGTPGYLDPEYQSSGNLNTKSDVYSFGVVLLELITGQPALKRPGNIHIVPWVSTAIERGDIQEILDPRLQGDFDTNSAWKAVEIALACVAPTGIQRLDMNHVLADLKECLETEVASRRSGTTDWQGRGPSNSLQNGPLDLYAETMAPHAR